MRQRVTAYLCQSCERSSNGRRQSQGKAISFLCLINSSMSSRRKQRSLPQKGGQKTLSIFIEFHSRRLNVCRLGLCALCLHLHLAGVQVWVCMCVGVRRLGFALARTQAESIEVARMFPGLSLWHVLRHVLSGFTGRASLRLAINFARYVTYTHRLPNCCHAHTPTYRWVLA